MRRLLTTGLCLALGACVSSGTKVTADQIASFVPGQTTEAQVIQKLGEPNNSSVMFDGSHMDVYNYSHTSVNATNFIPVVGLLAGGGTTNSTSAVFIFDRNGVLKSTNSGHGQSGLNTGLLNQ